MEKLRTETGIRTHPKPMKTGSEVPLDYMSQNLFETVETALLITVRDIFGPRLHYDLRSDKFTFT